MEIWRNAGINDNLRRGAFNYDPLGVLAKTGTLYYPAQRSCEIAAKLAADSRTMSHVTALLADGRPYHEAGASEAQELAAMLATLVAYLRACEAAGLRPRMALGQIAVGLAADADLFLTIAKLRAARRLVTRVAEASGAGSAAEAIKLAAHTSERMMARRDPWVNLLRTTTACAAAAFGGAESITVLPYTWALGQARRLRAPHRPQHPPGAAGGERRRARDRPRARLLVRREADRRSGEDGLDAFPGDRGQGRHGRGAGDRLHPGRDRERRRGTRPRHRPRPHRADRRVGVSPARRGRRHGRAAPAVRPRGQRRHRSGAAARRGASPRPTSGCAMPRTPTR